MSSPSLRGLWNECRATVRGLWNECRATVRGLERWRCCMAFFSSAFLAFGLYHVHSVSGITEGGVLGATLLLDHWFSLSPAVSGFVLNLLCYGWGWRLLGRSFIAYSLIATVGFSLPYKLYELFPPLWPQLAEMPLLAAVVGALFVGVGAGLSVRAGGASGGDDALAMCIAHVTGMGIQWAYLSTDLVVLGLSLTYIPLRRIGYSLLTVLISGQLIGLVQRLPLPWDKPRPEAAE